MAQSNLPIQLTSFIGREREIAEVRRLLLTAPIVTLTGAGGSGKTRLALQVGNSLSDAFVDGVWLVDLAPLREPAFVPQLVSQALGLHLQADQPLIEMLLDFTRPKQLLLILDNCEHLREACAQLTRELLSQSPGLRILATSREPLAIAGETIFHVSGLAMPSEDGELGYYTQNFMQFDAIHLFVERARAILPGFNLTPDNGWPIVEICRRLDGLPLALELASARTNVLTVQEIAARLHDRFALLVSSRTTRFEPRHHTLRAAIDWSFTLLAADEQTLLRRLAVFPAGWTLDMAEVVCAGEGMDGSRILHLLSLLADKSLIVAETTGRSQARYRLLETIREYALEKLDEAGETAKLRDRHLNLFLARAEEAAPKLGEAYQQLWLNWLEGEHDNLRAALAWSLEDTGGTRHVEAGLRIASALVRFWEIRGYVKEGLAWFERLLAQTDDTIPLGVHVNALVFASFLSMFLGDAPATLAYGRKAVGLAETAVNDHDPILTFALGGLSSGARVSGDYQTAFTIGERALQLMRAQSSSSFFLGMALLAQGDVAIQLGNFGMARERLDESLALARQDGDSFRIAHALNSQGDLARCEQDYPAACSAYEGSKTLLLEIDARHDLASILNNLGHTYMHLGDIERAQALFNESMVLHQDQQNKPGITECLIGFAAVAIVRGIPAAGVRLLSAAATINGRPNAFIWLATRLEYETYLDLAQSRLTEAEFQAEQSAGRSLTFDQAVNYAMNLPLEPDIEPALVVAADDLTRREREVVRLIGQGKSNSEIAAELVLSKRTVETHVSHILSRLDLSSRAQIMRWAMDHGLTQTLE